MEISGSLKALVGDWRAGEGKSKCRVLFYTWHQSSSQQTVCVDSLRQISSPFHSITHLNTHLSALINTLTYSAHTLFALTTRFDIHSFTRCGTAKPTDWKPVDVFALGIVLFEMCCRFGTGMERIMLIGRLRSVLTLQRCLQCLLQLNVSAF